MNKQAPVPPSGTQNLCSPGTAFGLGLIPGVGALCNGEYLKAFVHVMIFGLLISIASSTGLDSLQPMFILFIFAFYFYMPIEAFHTAKRRLLESQGLLDVIPPDRRREGLWAGLALTLMGGLLFLDNLIHGFMEQALRFWPLALIGFGTAKVASHFKKKL
jgi:cell wall-active antibiotic response 4TMS protein YvqF